MSLNNASYVATSDIDVSLFCRLDGVGDYSIAVCTAGQIADGVSHEGPLDYQAPTLGSVGPAIPAGRSGKVYGPGDRCQVKIGASVTAGDFLKPDANGKATKAYEGEAYSARCFQTVAFSTGDELADIQVERGVVGGSGVSLSGILNAAPQALSGAGAITVTEYLTNWTTTGADAGTLADGTFHGQLKKIQMIVDGGDGTLTPTNLSGGTTITFADVGDVAVLRWDGTDGAWRAVELSNDADGATGPVLA